MRCRSLQHWLVPEVMPTPELLSKQLNHGPWFFNHASDGRGDLQPQPSHAFAASFQRDAQLLSEWNAIETTGIKKCLQLLHEGLAGKQVLCMHKWCEANEALATRQADFFRSAGWQAQRDRTFGIGEDRYFKRRILAEEAVKEAIEHASPVVRVARTFRGAASITPGPSRQV